jgi:uncharacterized protein RhaS with RHS repeats
MRYGYDSPELNRFLRKDPIGFGGDALNLYRFCANDPIDRADPMGLDNQQTYQPIVVSAFPINISDFGMSSYSPDFGVFVPSGIGSNEAFSMSYVTYGGNWSDDDAKAFDKEFAEEWADPGSRENWEEAFESSNEFRVTPRHGLFGGNRGFQLQAFDGAGHELAISFGAQRSNNNVPPVVAGQGGSFEKNPQGDNSAANAAARAAAKAEGLPEKYMDEFHDAVRARTAEVGRKLSYSEIRDVAREVRQYYGR